MINFARSGYHDELIDTQKCFDHKDFLPQVEIKNLSFKHKRNDNFSSGSGSARLNETSDLRLSGGYPLGFSGWFDHADQQDAKMRRNHEEYTKFNKGK